MPPAGSRVVNLKRDFYFLENRSDVRRSKHRFEVYQKQTTFARVVVHCCYQTALLPCLWMLLLVLLGQTQKIYVVYSLSVNPFKK